MYYGILDSTQNATKIHSMMMVETLVFGVDERIPEDRSHIFVFYGTPALKRNLMVGGESRKNRVTCRKDQGN